MTILLSVTRTTQPYGAWPSPISAEMVAGKSLRFGLLRADDGYLYWSESRPEEGGRCVLMRVSPDGAPEEVLPGDVSVRSRVHEYGGGEFLAADGVIYYVDDETQDIGVCRPGATPERLTSAPDARFADMTLDAARNRLLAVAERHDENSRHPQNFVASVALEDAPTIATVLEGRDFYASPRVSPGGDMLAWLAWDLPHMPWEAAALYVAAIDDSGVLGEPQRLAGGDGSAVFQPEWSEDGALLFVWDETGWGNLYAWDGEKIRAIAPREAELFRPQWALGMSSWVELGDGRIATAFIEQGETGLALIGRDPGAVTPLETDLRSVDALAPFDSGIAVIGATDMAAPAVRHVMPGARETRVIRSAGDTGLKPGDISASRTLAFEGEDGAPVYALYYPPANASAAAPEGELPPAILTAHGGPTGSADRGLKLKIQYWTSRGFAVCDVDYSGSTGYGRAYRRRLDGQWGVRDVADVGAAARYLVDAGLADPERLLISGSSAGGYTVLMALVELDLFAAGACTYAVADLSRLLRITHKFEAGYLYSLTGATPENCEAVFAARSPLERAREITAPVIFFQGLEDKVVPPEQSRSMAETLEEGGVPVAYMEFQGEGHGFRRAQTIATVLEAEYAFYCRILGLNPEGALPQLYIRNRGD